MSKQSRRSLLKTIAVGSSALMAGKNLPANWEKPVIEHVILPAHAQTSTASCAPGVIYSNAIDNGTGFILPSPSNYYYIDPTPFGYSPTAGVEVLHANGVNGLSLAYLPLPNTLVPGTYTVTFDVGNFNNAGFITITNIGLRANTVFLSPTSSTTPMPASGAQLTWSLTYNLSAADIAALDFAIDIQIGPNTNGSLDNLIITRVCP